MPPPRPNPPSAGKPRRRPGPVMPGSWIWLVILFMLVGMFVLASMGNSGQVAYSDFWRVLNDPKVSDEISKVTFIGQENIIVEFKSTENLPPEWKERLHNRKTFET